MTNVSEVKLELEAIERELARTMPKGVRWVLIAVLDDGRGSACSSLDLDEADCVQIMRDMAATIEHDAPGNLKRETMMLSGIKGGSA